MQIDPEVQKRNKLFYSNPIENYSFDGYAHSSFYCPKCETYNWVYYGDIHNIKHIDPEVCRCWSCKHDFWVMEPDMVADFYPEEFEECGGDLGAMLKQDCGNATDGEKDAPYEKRKQA